MIKWTLLALASGAAGAYGAWSSQPCDSCGACAVAAAAVAGPLAPRAAGPVGIYVEARDATVWGGACHISSEAESAGKRAALGWSFTAGSHGGVDLAGTQVVAVVEGSCNLQGAEVFGTSETPEITSEIWVDAPSALAREAAIAYVSEVTDLGAVGSVHATQVTLHYGADCFEMEVEGSLRVKGESMADRSCCTMPESRWYSPLAEVGDSVVGNPSECRFEGVAGSMDRWSFEGENSVFVASLGQ